MRSILNISYQGRQAIVYPMLLQAMSSVMHLAISMGLVAFVLMLVKKFQVLATLTPETVWNGCLFISLPALAFWIFSAACRVQWWHGFNAAYESQHRNLSELADLPALMVIDVCVGFVRSICYISMGWAIWGILYHHSVWGAWTAACAGLVLFCLTMIESAWTAERIITGRGLWETFKTSLVKVVHHPISTLAMYLIPNVLSVALILATVLLAQAEFTLSAWIAGIAAFILPYFVPVFWLDLMRSDMRKA